MPRYEITERKKAVKTENTEMHREAGIAHNVREAILEVDPEAYGNYFEAVQHMDTMPLHNSFGEKNRDGGPVISFNIAGSGYKQPLRYELGLAGKGNAVFYEKGKTKELHKRSDVKDNKMYTVVYQDGSSVDMTGAAMKAEWEYRTDEALGEGGILNHKNIRRKVDVQEGKGTKTKYSIPGPGVIGGLMDNGSYSIEHTRGYIDTLCRQHFDELLNDPKFMNSNQQVTMNFTGHSRGAVGAMESALHMKWLLTQEPYTKLAGRVHANTIVYDPVPGPKTAMWSNVNHNVNLKEASAEMVESHLAALDENDHTTVVYSMGCQHYEATFPPMKIIGADTVLLTSHNHDAGLKDVEMQNGEKKRSAYINTENMQAYRASGLNELPKGVFIADENNVMVRAKSLDQVENVIDKIYEGALKSVSRRHRRINEACNSVFDQAGQTPTIKSIARGFDAHDPFYVPSSKDFKQMKTSFTNLTKLMKAKEIDTKAAEQALAEMKTSAFSYLKSKESEPVHNNLTQARMNVAKDIIRFVNETRVNMLMGLPAPEVDSSAKTNDMRQGYLKIAKESLGDNLTHLKAMAESSKEGGHVDFNLFKNVLISAMADSYFIARQDTFMPNALPVGAQSNAATKRLDNLFGDGENSLIATFANSEAVNRFVTSSINNKDIASDLANPKAAQQMLNDLIQSTAKELSSRNSPQRDPHQPKPQLRQASNASMGMR